MGRVMDADGTRLGILDEFVSGMSPYPLYGHERTKALKDISTIERYQHH